MKICPKCKIEKFLDCFNKNKSTKDGLQTYCRDCSRRFDKEWRLANPVKDRANKDKWWENHPEEYRIYHRKYESAWRTSEKTRTKNQRRRSLMLGSIPTLTLEEWKEILEDFNYLCFWCGAPWEHQDHLVALVNGGTHSANNVVPSCATCNLRKGSKDPLDFLLSIS